MDGAPVGLRNVYFEHIIQWTNKQFGDTQALVYAETLSLALMVLTEGPDILGAKARDEILKGLWSLHVARQGRKGRHYILFRVAPRGSGDVIEVLLCCTTPWIGHAISAPATIDASEIAGAGELADLTDFGQSISPADANSCCRAGEPENVC